MKKIKFNIFDIILVCTILLIVVASVFRMININKTPDILKDQKVTYTFSVYNEDAIYKDIVKQGDKIYLYPEQIYCGEVVDINYNYIDEIIIYPDNTTKSHQNPSKVNIHLTVETFGDVAENGFYVSENINLVKGNVFDINTRDIILNGEITEITLN